MIAKTGGIITQMARSGAAVSMLVVLASCGGGQTERRPSAAAEAFFKRAEAAEVARKAAIAGKPQPSDAGAQFPFQLDEAAKEAPFLIEAMWQDQFLDLPSHQHSETDRFLYRATLDTGRRHPNRGRQPAFRADPRARGWRVAD